MKPSICIVLVLTLFFNCKDGEKTEVSDKKTSKIAQLFYNGDIITMASDQEEYVEAIVEENGKIVFVGSQKDAETKYGNANKIDLNGKTLLPGFIDPHSHFGMVSNTMGQVDLNPKPVGTVVNIDDILKKLEAFKEERNIPDGQWIFGWGYDDGQLAEKRHPTKRDIDKVLPNNPVYLQHTSGHMGVANSLALEKLNVNAESKSPEGGNIERFPNSKEPTGLVQETAMYPFVGNMLEILAKDQATYFGTTQEYYASNGITTAQDGMTDRNTIRFFQSQADAGKLNIDLVSLAGYAELDSNVQDSSLHFKNIKTVLKFRAQKS